MVCAHNFRCVLMLFLGTKPVRVYCYGLMYVLFAACDY